MKVLLDTQALLWFQSADSKLSDKARKIIDNSDNSCFVSIVSLWEMAIKVNLNKLNIDIGFDAFPEYLIAENFKILDIKPLHLKGLSKLYAHHKDPFDRLLIAQAITENLAIVSADRHFASYPVKVIW
jgi:PIN domain nuclease of toxin-antitoxin system